MMRRYSRVVCSLLLIFLLSNTVISFPAAGSTGAIGNFSDVPSNSYALNDINSLRALGITNGIGNNNFGYGQQITRGDFVTFLVRLMGWELLSPAAGSFSDNRNPAKHYYKTIETALAHKVIQKDSEKFRPEAPITRDEMAVMIVRSLDYGTLAGQLDYLPKPFPDVSENTGYITIAKDLGIINGTAAGFLPKGTALKEQAAAMMMRMYNRLRSPITDLNAFYAISSNSQKDLIPSLSSVGFGWSRLTFDNSTGAVVLNTARDGSSFQEYSVPEGFSERIALARDNNVPSLLSVFASQGTSVTDSVTGNPVGLLEYLLTKPEVYRKIISDLTDRMASTTLETETGSFDGVVIDFESMKGSMLKQAFIAFLKELRDKLGPDKKLYVTVPPVMGKGRPYFDAYDYRAIGDIADKVILMSHDYAPVSLTESDMQLGSAITPLTPLEEVYQALKSITDSTTGVQDKSKIMLQISFNWVGWRKSGGKIIKQTPDYYSLENFMKLFELNPEALYSDLYRNPYIKLTDNEGMERIVWYEDSRSVSEKIKLAKMFGVTGISLWRLGNIPNIADAGSSPRYMDVWDTILKSRGSK